MTNTQIDAIYKFNTALTKKTIKIELITELDLTEFIGMIPVDLFN
jgi:hypothetical protein